MVYGLRLQGVRDRRVLNEACERALRAAALWSEVKDQLSQNALTLSTGQQQRLVIARAIAIEPEVLLLDEPTSALDPELVGEGLATMRALADQGLTMIVVTHEISFAREAADRVVFMDGGVVVEQGTPEEVIANPQHPRTQAFLSRFI